MLQGYLKYYCMPMDEANPDGQNGGGGGGPEPKNEPSPDDKGSKNVTLTQEQFDKLIAKANGKTQEPSDDDDDLLEKSRRERENKGKNEADTKRIESAIKFDVQKDAWLKENKSLLPSDIEDLFTTASKETYDSPIEKDSQLKAGIVQSFFNVQENADLLTASQKNKLDEYLKLTHNGKKEKAQEMYESLFEPTFETLKRVKRAEALQKGHNYDSSSDQAYKEKMMKLSRKRYLGEK